jgi:pimeloyl-ACP methyl ester carboxylesterase
VLRGGSVELSGLLAQPETPPRALVLALHGGGMTAAYFDGRAHPDLSLLRLGHRLGFTVLALDRPGYGRSSGSLPRGQLLSEQAGTVYGALDDFAARHATGAGVFVIGHSFGLKLGLFLAAHPRGKELLGVDGSGAAYRYEPALHPAAARAEPGADGSMAAYASRSPRELFWGSESLYPPGTFTQGMRPIAPVPELETYESALWPDLLPGVAAEIRVPFQFSVAEHEQWWQVTDADLAEYRALFTAAPRLVVRRQPAAGHNISLGWAARSYHLNALAFAEQCLLSSLRAGSGGARG